MRGPVGQGDFKECWEHQAKLDTRAGPQLALHSPKRSSLLGNSDGIVGENEQFLALKKQRRVAGCFAGPSYNFVPDMEKVDPDDNRSGRLSRLRFGTQGAMGSVE